MPWHLPALVWSFTPWGWVRIYYRVGERVLWYVWVWTRPLMWGLEDRARALDADVERRLKEKVQRESH